MRLREEEAAIRKRKLGGDNHMSGADSPLRRLDGAGISCLHAGRSRLLENVAAVAVHQRGEPGNVLPGMELRLFVDSDRCGDRVGEVGLCRQLCIETGAPGRLDLALDLTSGLGIFGIDEVAGPFEVAVKAMLSTMPATLSIACWFERA